MDPASRSDPHASAQADPFALFSTPRKFAQDLKALESRFYAFARELHPDRFATRSAEERKDALERMSAVNDGYQQLKDADARRETILRLEGVTAPKGAAPADLAGEWFDLQDTLMESPERAPALLADFAAELDRREVAVMAVIAEAERAYDADGSREALEKIAREIQARAYLASMKRDVAQKQAKLGGAR